MMKCLILLNILIHLSFISAQAQEIFNACKKTTQITLEADCKDCGEQLNTKNKDQLSQLASLATSLNGDAAFREELAKRVEALIDAQKRKNKILKECFENSRSHTRCADYTEKVKADVKNNWQKMRLQLALSKPELKPGVKINRFKASNDYQFKTKINHAFNDYAKLTPLSVEEVKLAKDQYIKEVERAAYELKKENPKYSVSIEKLIKDLKSGTEPFRKFEHNDFRFALAQKIEAYQVEQENKYFQTMAEVPVLGFATSANATNTELSKGFEKLGTKLADYQNRLFKQKDRRGQKWVDKDWQEIFAFTHIIEEILTQKPELCGVAIKMKKELEKQKTREVIFDAGIGLAAGVACVAGAEICIAAGLATGFKSLDKAQTKLANLEASRSLAPILGEYETLSEAQKDIWVETVFLPLSFFGAGKSAVVAAREARMTDAAKRLRAPTFIAEEDASVGFAKGSVSEQIGLKAVGKTDRQDLIELPKVKKLNKTLGLTEKSNVFFIAADKFADGIVPRIEYHRKLAEGKVYVSQIVAHDIYDHAAGFVYLSKSPSFEKAKRILKESFEVIDNPNLSEDVKKQAHRLREEIGSLIEEHTTNITQYDRWGQKELLDAEIAIFSKGIQDSFEKLLKIKSMRVKETLNPEETKEILQQEASARRGLEKTGVGINAKVRAHTEEFTINPQLYGTYTLTRKRSEQVRLDFTDHFQEVFIKDESSSSFFGEALREIVKSNPDIKTVRLVSRHHSTAEEFEKSDLYKILKQNGFEIHETKTVYGEIEVVAKKYKKIASGFILAPVSKGKVAEAIEEKSTTYALGIRRADETQYLIPTDEKINKTLSLVMPNAKIRFLDEGFVSFDKNKENWAKGIVTYDSSHPHDAIEHLAGHVEFAKHPESELSQKLVEQSLELASSTKDKIVKQQAQGVGNDIMQAIEEYTNRISKADQASDTVKKKKVVEELRGYIRQVDMRFKKIRPPTWSEVSSSNPPSHVPYFSLGLTTHLERFTASMRKKHNHDVFDYGATRHIHGTSKNIEAQVNFAHASVDLGFDELKMMEHFIKQAPDHKVILFNLDGVDLKDYTKFPNGRTNREIDFILGNKEVFNHVRWFKDEKELTYDELKKLFEPKNPKLFK